MRESKYAQAKTALEVWEAKLDKVVNEFDPNLIPEGGHQGRAHGLRRMAEELIYHRETPVEGTRGEDRIHLNARAVARREVLKLASGDGHGLRVLAAEIETLLESTTKAHNELL